MLESIKQMIAEKTSIMEAADLLLEDTDLMESMDESIVLTPYMEADDDEDTAEAEEPEENDDDTEDDTGADKSEEDEDPMSAEIGDDDLGGDGDLGGEDEDLFSGGSEFDTGGEDDKPFTFDQNDEDDGEDPMPLPGDDLPEPIGAQTGEPINTDDDIMSMELSMGSDTPRDILPIPPANAADAIAGDGDPLMQGVDSGFGGNSMSDVGTMDGSSDMGDPMDSPMDDSLSATAGDPMSDPIDGGADDLSLESVEERIKKDVNHDEQHKKKVTDAQKKSAAADEPFGEGFVFDLEGNTITESAEDDGEFVYDPFAESRWDIGPKKKNEGLRTGAKPKKSSSKKGLLDDEMVMPERKKDQAKTEGYGFDALHYDPFSEAIQLDGGGQDANAQPAAGGEEEAPVDGSENQVTAAVKDKVDEAEGDASAEDLGGNLGGDDLGGMDMGADMGLGGGGNTTAMASKMIQNLTKLQTDIAKMSNEIAQELAGQ